MTVGTNSSAAAHDGHRELVAAGLGRHAEKLAADFGAGVPEQDGRLGVVLRLLNGVDFLLEVAVGFEQVQPAVAIGVRRIDPHRALKLPLVVAGGRRLL